MMRKASAVGLIALVLQPSSAAFGAHTTSRASVLQTHDVASTSSPVMAERRSWRSTSAIMLADDAPTKRAAVDMRFAFEETVAVRLAYEEYVAEAKHVEDCLVRFPPHNAASKINPLLHHGPSKSFALQQLSPTPL